jgi:predicted negative regulator of RcsB-dependent stress response
MANLCIYEPPFFLHFLKDYTRAIQLPIYEVFIILKDVIMAWQKWGSKQVLEKRKTSLSLMEVFNIAWGMSKVTS